jgi:hypothetical protein
VRVEYHSTPALYVAFDDDKCGCPECASQQPIGFGKTAEEAITDLAERSEEARAS